MGNISIHTFITVHSVFFASMPVPLTNFFCPLALQRTTASSINYYSKVVIATLWIFTAESVIVQLLKTGFPCATRPPAAERPSHDPPTQHPSVSPAKDRAPTPNSASGGRRKLVSGVWHINTRYPCLLYTSPSPRDGLLSRMPSSA